MEVALSDQGLANLREVPGVLRSLDLSKSPVSDAGLAHLGHLSNLRNLGLAHTKVTGIGLGALENAPWLRRLVLRGAPITDEGLKHLGKLPRLEVLDLSETKITSDALESLQALTSLRELELRDTGLKASDLAALQAALPKCRINQADQAPPSIEQLMRR